MTAKIAAFFTSLRTYWRHPAKGRYMSFREILSLSVGGIGQKLVVWCIGQMIISIGNTLIGNTIGIDPGAMYVIYLVSVLSGFPLTALRARMIDNTRSMKGKYRPYIVTMGIPTAVLGIAFILFPYERVSLMGKCAVVLACNVGFQFLYNFYNDAFDSLIYVLSPNSIERSDVLSVKSVIENFSPSIANIFLPLVARLITGENTLYDLRVFRVLFPAMLAGGFLLSLLAYVNTEEKIVQARTHVRRIRFSDALRAIARNKYFWVISLAGWIGFLESSFGNILGWMYNYQHACSAVQYSVVTAIAGNASFWPNLVAPFFIRKYGKKKILIFTNALNVFFILLMLPIVRRTGQTGTIWLLLGCIFVNQFITSLGHLLNPSIQADIRDYQQYVTGERIDGMFAAVGLIGNVITLATSSVLPAIYNRAGLNAATAQALGYNASNVYDVLFNQAYFVRISSVLIMASVVGAALNVIPFFFYDLTETDQKGMVAVLKLRAMFEDYDNGVLREETLIEVGDMITQAQADQDLTPPAAAGSTKQEKRQIAQETERLAISARVREELHRFETAAGKTSLEQARLMVAAGPEGFLNVELPTKQEVGAMPRATAQEREMRRDALMRIESVAVARRALKRDFPQGLTPFDNSVFDRLFHAEEENAKQLQETLQAVKSAKETGNTQALPALRQAVKTQQAQRTQIGAEIKQASDDYARYYRAAKPYLDAKRLLAQAENYSRLEEILALYAQAKAAQEAAN